MTGSRLRHRSTAAVRRPRLRSLLPGALATVLAIVAAQSASAQATGTIRGTVQDARLGQGIPDVQIVVTGSRRGSITTERGTYVISAVPAGRVTVRAQKIGYGPMQVVVTVSPGDTAVANFSINAAALSLDEVIVTGTPGATEKRTVGNTVATIKADQLTSTVPIPNVTELLQGRAAGVNVITTSGSVGTTANIRIRGAGSMSANTQPVIFIDGVRMESGSQTSFGNSNAIVQATSALDAIDPNDIESMEIIKGPAAATLYGADAAAGVIQIITKKGRIGQKSATWTVKADAGTIDWHLDRKKTYWYCTDPQIANKASFPGCAELGANPANRLLMDSPLDAPGALRTGRVNELSASLTGGGDRSSYFFSAGNDAEKGVLNNNFFNRNNARGNFQVTVRDNLTAAMNISLGHTASQQGYSDNSSNSILRNAYRDRPSGPWPWERQYRGFGPQLANQYFNQVLTDRYILGTNINYSPTSWFQNRLNAGVDVDNQTSSEFYGIDTTGRAPFGATVANGQISHLLPNTQRMTIDYAGTVTTTLPRSMTSALSVGMQYTDLKYNSYQVVGTGLVANQLNLVGGAATTTADQGYTKQSSLGTYVQEQFGWRDRLFLTGAVRVDNNSAFGSNFKLVAYPKASASYVISEEPFFHISHVDQLKLRAAWGQAGNAPKPFTAVRAYAATQTPVGDIPVNAVYPSAYGNPDLRAERGSEVELGFDMSALKGRAGLEFTYYNKQTRDALVAVPAPPSTGFLGSYLANLGTIGNSGMELTLNLTPFTSSRLKWESAITGSTNHNKLVSFGTNFNTISFGTFAVNQRFQAGYPLGAYWATDVVRDASGAAVLTNGSVKVDTAKYLGPSQPTREVSFANTFTIFKNVRLYGFFDYKGGFYLFDGIKYVNDRLDQNTFAVNDPTADPTQVQILKSGANLPSTRRADFVKLREISLGYTLPARLANSVHASSATLSFSARNLAIWKLKGYPGPDPEVEFFSGVNGTATTLFDRTDYGSIPMTRRLVTTINLTF
jgi:TonB-linked SusC/RagA family outer membrane protein